MMIEVCVKAGGYPIGQMTIERRNGGNDYDDINTYQVLLRLHNVDIMPLAGICRHRYGDEWPILLQKALESLTDLAIMSRS